MRERRQKTITNLILSVAINQIQNRVMTNTNSNALNVALNLMEKNLIVLLVALN